MKSLESCQYSFAIFDFRRCFVVVNLYQTEHKIVHTVYLKLPFLSCRLSIQEGLFVGTTSSIVQLVESFNGFFRCPSDSGKCKGNLLAC